MQKPPAVSSLATLTRIAAVAVALAPAGFGCGGLVVYDGEPGEGGATPSGSSSGPSPSTSSGPSTPPTAIILDEGAGYSTIRVADFGLSCNDPRRPAPYERCGWFDLEIRLPSSYLDSAYGEVSAYDDAVSSYYSVSGPAEGGSCSFGSGGGGAALFGKLRILGADDASVDIELEDWEGFISSPAVDGRFRAERCDG